MNRNIAIIGAGISGMSCAYMLTDKGYNISIFAKAFSPNITSDKAAAFWFPYHIRNDKRGIEWCSASYNFYTKMAGQADTGISMQKLVKVLRHGITDDEPVWMDFMPPGSLRIMQQHELAAGVATGFKISVPLIETQVFLPYLRSLLEQNNVQFIQREISAFNELTGAFDYIVNCSGLGARGLCNDSTLIPVRGQVGILSPCSGMHIYLDNERPLYIVPRKDAIIIGGTYEEGVETETTEPGTVERLLNNAYAVFPALKAQQVLGSRAGLRPYRAEVRVEQQAGTNIIHNYGHGGSGFTLAFGCAQEVVNIINKM